MLTDDLHIAHAAALPTSPSEHDALSEEIDATDNVNHSADNTASIVGALNSTGKRLSIALNSAAASLIHESEEQHSSTTSPIEPTPVQQVDNIQSYPLPSSGMYNLRNVDYLLFLLF